MSKPTFAIGKPKPATHEEVKDQFAAQPTFEALPPTQPAPLPLPVLPDFAPLGPKRSNTTFVKRKDGTELRKKTIYLSPDLAKLMAKKAVDLEINESDLAERAILEFLARH
jgi:hypothetical protein